MHDDWCHACDDRPTAAGGVLCRGCRLLARLAWFVTRHPAARRPALVVAEVVGSVWGRWS